MKLLLPVAGMMVGTSICCCGDFGSMIEELANNQGGMTDDEAAEAIAKAIEEAADEGASGAGTATAPVVGGGSADGLCGRFKTDGLLVPSGLSVFSCTTMGTTENTVLRGSGDPKAACGAVRDWAEGAGWSKLHEVDSSGTTAITLRKDGGNLSLACMDVAGTTTVSISSTPGM